MRSGLIGLLGSTFAVIFGILVGGGNVAAYIDIPSLFITLAGSGFAVLTANSWDNFKKIGTLIKVAFRVTDDDPTNLIIDLVSFSEKARREGLLSLEDEIDLIMGRSPFLGAGVRLIVDGTEPDIVKNILLTEVQSMQERHIATRKVIEDWAVFAPAFGMIGTLIGLVMMLKNIGGDVSMIGQGMAAALITTFYGSLATNLFLTPIGNKLARSDEREVLAKEVIVEGVLSIQSGDNPRTLQRKLLSFYSEDVRKRVTEKLGE